jgi:hypothetical protein
VVCLRQSLCEIHDSTSTSPVCRFCGTLVSVWWARRLWLTWDLVSEPSTNIVSLLCRGSECSYLGLLLRRGMFLAHFCTLHLAILMQESVDWTEDGGY